MRRWTKTTMLAAALLVAACGEGPVGLPVLAVDHVDVLPSEGLVLLVGDSLHLTAVPRTANGSGLGSVDVEWSLESTGAAELSAHRHRAVVRGLAPGTARVHATSEGHTGTVTITVVADEPEQPPAEND